MVAHETEQNGLNFEQALQRPLEMAKEYPVASMLVLFGVGLGVGVLIGQSAPSMSSSRSGWDPHNWWDDASRRVESASRYMDTSSLERMGQQVCDAIVSALPKNLARQFQS